MTSPAHWSTSSSKPFFRRALVCGLGFALPGALDGKLLIECLFRGLWRLQTTLRLTAATPRDHNACCPVGVPLGVSGAPAVFVLRSHAYAYSFTGSVTSRFRHPSTAAECRRGRSIT